MEQGVLMQHALTVPLAAGGGVNAVCVPDCQVDRIGMPGEWLKFSERSPL